VQIHIETLDHGVVTVEAEGSDTIENIKQKIADKTGVAEADMTLTFEGTPLVDDHTLADYDIRAEATLQLAVAGEEVVTSEIAVSGTFPTTGGGGRIGGAGGMGVALALVVLGAALVRIVRRPATR